MLELVFQIIKLLGGLFLSDHRLALTGLNTLKHAIVVPLLFLTLRPFLIQLNLEELHFLRVYGLVLIYFLLHGLIFIFNFLQKVFKFSDPLTGLLEVLLFLLVEAGYFFVVLRLQFFIRLTQRLLQVFGLNKFFLK